MSLFGWLAVMLAGGLGATSRFAADSYLSARFPRAWLPAGILTVNLAGSFLAGLAAGLIPSGSVVWQIAVAGFLGAFTTFSTVLVTVLTQWLEAHRLRAAVYLLTTVAGTVALAAAGLAAGSLPG